MRYIYLVYSRWTMYTQIILFIFSPILMIFFTPFLAYPKEPGDWLCAERTAFEPRHQQLSDGQGCRPGENCHCVTITVSLSGCNFNIDVVNTRNDYTLVYIRTEIFCLWKISVFHSNNYDIWGFMVFFDQWSIFDMKQVSVHMNIFVWRSGFKKKMIILPLVCCI